LACCASSHTVHVHTLLLLLIHVTSLGAIHLAAAVAPLTATILVVVSIGVLIIISIPLVPAAVPIAASTTPAVLVCVAVRLVAI
jgi:hypothetical protein